MNKIKNKIIILIFILFTATIVSLQILLTEKNKKNAKLAAENEYYMTLNANFEKYRKEYQDQIAAIRTENIQKMEAAKKAFEELIAKQPDLVKQQATYIPPAKTVSQKVAKTIKVTKPSSTPKTKTS